MITVKCSCGKTYQVKDSYANKKAKCTCGKVISVPQISAEELDKPTEKINFSCCKCGKTFNVSKKYKGKKVRCKSCHTTQTVPMKSQLMDKDDNDDQHDEDAPRETDSSSENKTTDQEDADDQVANDTQTTTEDDETPSSEKPKRLLIICIIMMLMGAIAYGLFLHFSEQQEESSSIMETSPAEKTDSKKQINATTEENAQEIAESETTDDPALKDITPDETQLEKKNPLTEPLATDPGVDELEPKAEEKPAKTMEKKTEKSQKIETETIPNPNLTPSTKTQDSPPLESDNQNKMIASVDPELLSEDTKDYLRATPMTYTKKQVIDMIQKYNFYEAQFNPNGGFPNRFVDNRNGTITDNETLLMWQKSGTREMVSWKKAPEYIDRLNNRKFSGYSDWRLPTLEELHTLSEPRHSRQGLYISSFFSQKQGIVASSDSCTYDGKNLPWYISFLRGISNCISYNLIDEFHVRAVRSMDRPDKKIHN